MNHLPRDPQLLSLLEPASADQEAGVDLDGTLELDALETAARAPDEAAIDGIEVEDERDWRSVETHALTLLSKSKDVRIAVHLARARLHHIGFDAFCDAIVFVCELAQRYWESAYPRIEYDDVRARLNALEELGSREIVARLRTVSLGDAKPTWSIDTFPLSSTALQALTDAVQQCIQTTVSALRDLREFVLRKTGHHLQLAGILAAEGDRPGLLDKLDNIRRATVSEDTLKDDTDQASSELTADHPGSTRITTKAVGNVTNREEVIAALDMVCAYYQNVEPSSPVPLLLRRAQRLAVLDFLAIVRDVARQGLHEAFALAGLELEPDVAHSTQSPSATFAPLPMQIPSPQEPELSQSPFQQSPFQQSSFPQSPFPQSSFPQSPFPQSPFSPPRF